MSTINIRLYEIARTKFNLSEADAKDFTEAIENMVKEDIKASTGDYKSLWREDFHSLDKKIIDSKNELSNKIEQSKMDTIKWVFGFFVTLALLIIGIAIKK